jgi:uncharacterized protein (TIGR02271 family)
MGLRDEPEPGRDTGDLEITRSEEQLQVGFDRVPYRRMRIVKYVTTEETTRTVQVRREELRIEPDDVVDSQPIERWAARLTPDEPLEITLSEEQVVIETRVVPIERVRVWVEDVSVGDQLIEGTLRQERIDIVDSTMTAQRDRLPGDGPDDLDRDRGDRLGGTAEDDRPVY